MSEHVTSKSFNPFTPLCEGNYDKGSSKKEKKKKTDVWPPLNLV